MLRLCVATFFLISLSLISCTDPDVPDTSTKEVSFDGILGKWEDISSENKFEEIWSKTSDDLFVGQGYVLSYSDTIFIESLKIERDMGDWTYYAQVGQDNSGVPFKMVSNDNNRIVFENMTHPFPQRIIYELISNVEMKVFIEGDENGVFRKMRFSFVKTD